MFDRNPHGACALQAWPRGEGRKGARRGGSGEAERAAEWEGAVPQGSDCFKTYFSPANRFGLVNTLGEQVYMFESQDAKGTKIEIESESNFVNALLRPAMVVELTSSN